MFSKINLLINTPNWAGGRFGVKRKI